MTNEEFHAYENAYNNRINKTAWLNGMYISDALNCALGNMFRKKGKQPLEYPNEPYGYGVDDKKQNKKILSIEDKQEIMQQAICDVY